MSLRFCSRLVLLGLALTGATVTAFEQDKATPVLKQTPRAVTAAERLVVLRRASVWKPTDIPAMDVVKGPVADGFAPEQEVVCDYAPVKYGGNTPKFGCEVVPKDPLKVRYGTDNGELYAGVAATRLLWMLGFGADGLYPVRVICRKCPREMAAQGVSVPEGLRFDFAAIERTFPGRKIASAIDNGGWAWPELAAVDPAAGGAPLAHRDALALLAVLLQHTDSKAEQQRLVCPSAGPGRDELLACAEPFMLIHDLGKTFGRANKLNRGSAGSVNLELWSTTPIWKDKGRCVGNLAKSFTGTLGNPVISEAGRAFLANLLDQVTDAQLHDLFAVARLDRKPHGGAPIDAWVTAFKQKRLEIASTRCP